jgi:GR25 family glycosyltransferase involved in LPS biosynthesis
MPDKKIVFIPSGRLGNAFFRYLACALINIKNPSLSYCSKEDFIEEDNFSNQFTFYSGVDHEGNDISSSSSLVVAYNTLGFYKDMVDLDNLKSNAYVNKENGHGIFVRKTITLNDDNFLAFINKKLKYFNIKMNGFFQFGHIYLQYKEKILNYIVEHQNEHFIETDKNEKFLIRDLLNDINLPLEKQYDIVIHIRLGDFNGRPDYIELKYYLYLFETMDWLALDGANKRICILFDPSISNPGDCVYIEECMRWFKERNIPISIESNNLLMDFNIMKQATTLISSMSTLAWVAAYLSKRLKKCYMPDYNFYEIAHRRILYFKKPIENTTLYPVKTTQSNLSSIKTIILTLPEYSNERLIKLDNLRQRLTQICLESSIYNGVNGKDIILKETADEKIKQLLYQDTILTYNRTVRLYEKPMTRGEFGCAWSHLNLFEQLVQEDSRVSYYLILEDDVELVKPLDELYELLKNIPSDMDLCHLAKSDWYPFIKTIPVNAYFSECKKHFFNRTTAYLVSKKGAEKLLNYHQGAINVPIDDLFNMIFRLVPDFRFYVPSVADYFFKEQDNISSIIQNINQGY